MNTNPPPAAPETLDGGATLHQLPGLPDPEPPESIARGCALAIGGIAAVVFELEGEIRFMEDLEDDDDGSPRGCYASKRRDYGRKIHTLAEAQKVLEALAAETHAQIVRAKGGLHLLASFLGGAGDT